MDAVVTMAGEEGSLLDMLKDTFNGVVENQGLALHGVLLKSYLLRSEGA